jgi:hypothetical protein
MRYVHRLALRSAEVGIRERDLDRSQHLCQRRAKLVADVRKERRHGAIDLRERFSAPALVLTRPHNSER